MFAPWNLVWLTTSSPNGSAPGRSQRVDPPGQASSASTRGRRQRSSAPIAPEVLEQEVNRPSAWAGPARVRRRRHELRGRDDGGGGILVSGSVGASTISCCSTARCTVSRTRPRRNGR